jgi:arsenate reductase (thioredoxin)
MAKQRVLFICVHNSARSQMAEAFLNKLSDGKIEAESAGLEPGVLNLLAVLVMKEIGIDISGNKTKSVFDIVKKGTAYSYVITVCDESNAGRCPVFPGITKRLHWSFPDPSSFSGTHEEKLQKTREVRDQVKVKIEKWLCDLKNNNPDKDEKMEFIIK